MSSIKDFIKQANAEIKKENRIINELNKEIADYEAVIDVMNYTGNKDYVRNYREKISKCHEMIDKSFENIRYNRDVILKLRMIGNIIKRGEKSA